MPEEAPPTVVAVVGPPGVSLAFNALLAFSLAVLTVALVGYTGWQNHAHQIIDPSLHQADP